MNRYKWFSRGLLLILLLCHITAYAADSDPATTQADDRLIYLFPESMNSSVNFGVGLGVADVLDADERRRIECQKNFRSHLAPDPYRADEQSPEISTVMQLALNRFPFFSGLKETVTHFERTLDDYSRRIMLSGEIKVRRLTDNSFEVNENISLGAQFATQKDASPKAVTNTRLSFADQLAVRYVRWGSGFNLGNRELSLNLHLGDAIRFTAAAGEDPWLGVLFTFKI
ncbi:MAG: hypothetical protein U5L07_01200 [Desulfobacterales bacterium]|nr:hypothetical protein [Desulfobacterales bacterium]